MAEGFTDRLRKLVEPIMEAQHNHPFVQGVGDGTLDLEKFKFWVRQDYLYLIEYARLFSLAAARSPSLEEMGQYADLAQYALATEMELHRSYAREFGISVEELEHEEKAPTCQAYTDFLVRTASVGSFGEFAAAFLPCVDGYCEIGQRLASRGLPSDERYAKWIQMYGSSDMLALDARVLRLVDSVAAGQPLEELHRMERAYITSARYEYLFWEMCWQKETWPV